VAHRRAQTTTITGIAADATTVKYADAGNNWGVAGAANPSFGTVVDLIANIGENGSTEPAKRYFKYARPWRWSSSVKVVPVLEAAKSTTPNTDGGFVGGHSHECTPTILQYSRTENKHVRGSLKKARKTSRFIKS
jgi:hypothetical protein